MIVVAVITVVASIAFVGIRQNSWDSAYRRFTEDVMDGVSRARMFAVSEQTRVQVEVYGDGIQVWYEDPITKQPDQPLFQQRLGDTEDALIGSDVCVRGVFRGVQVPGQVVNDPIPGGCAGEGGAPDYILEFFPDGHMEWQGETLNGAGITLAIADERVVGNEIFTFIQVFPGGLVRKFEGVTE